MIATRPDLQALALAEERRRLSDAQAIGAIVSWEMDVATRDITTSDSLLELYGIDQFPPGGAFEAHAGRVYPEDQEALREAMVACSARGTPVHHRYRITRLNDGALRWFDLRGQAVSLNGRIERVVDAAIDVTEQVLAQSNAARAHAFQRGLLAAVGQSLIATDLEGHVISMEPGCGIDLRVVRSRGVGEVSHRPRIVASIPRSGA